MSTTTTTILTTPTPGPSPTGRRVVRELVRFELVGAATDEQSIDPIPLRGLLRWTSTSPHEVTITFLPGAPRQAVTWSVARDLLAAGLDGPAGLGDVSVLPDLHSRTHRELVLSSPTGRSAFRFPAAELVAFLDRTRAAEGGAR